MILNTFAPNTMLVSITAFLILCAFLPIPVRSQSSPASGVQVQFPATSAACTSCKPAFSSPSCQLILSSIAQSSTTPISNATLVDCQCSGSFLSLYPVCVQCFTETDQLDLVFGSSQIPTLSSLNQYCNTASLSPNSQATTVTKTVTKTSSSTSATTSPTSDPKNPSSAVALKRRLGLKVVYAVAALAVVYY